MSFITKTINFFKSKKFIINALLFIVVWLVIIFGGRSYFDLFTQHGVEVEVPNLLNNNVKDIPALIGDRALKYEVLDSIYNPDLVEGTIVYQSPMATDSSGLKVKKDRVIKVRVSKRSRLVNIPNVVSKSERFASGMLTSKGLRTRVKYVPSNEDQGVVISQKFNGKDVVDGQQVPINSVMELTVGKRSEGSMVQVPNLHGLTIKEAEERLTISGLRSFVSCSSCMTASDSLNFRVMRQTPVAADSSMIPEGATITIFATQTGELDD